MKNDRLPPRDLDAERAVLGSMIRRPELIDELLGMVRAEHFYTDAHQKIFRAVEALHARHRPIEVVTVAKQLEESGHFADVDSERAGGYLFDLFDNAPIRSPEYEAAAVRRKSVARSIIRVCTDAASRAFSEDPADLLADLEREVVRLSESGTDDDTVHVSTVVSEVMQLIDERKRGSGSQRIPTRYSGIDYYMTGLKPGALILIAARTSIGKTTFALNLIHNISVEQRIPSLVISLEQKRSELIERLMTAHADVDSHLVSQGKLTPEMMGAMMHAGDRIGNSPIWINHTPTQRVAKIVAESRKHQRRNGVRIVFIDYGQLIDTDDKTVRRHEQMADVTRRLKGLARDLDVPVVCLCQVNRGAETRADGRPTLADLRESGSWEQDADDVLLLHRPKDESKKESPPHEFMIEVIIAKQRAGPTASVMLHYERSTGRFLTIERG